MTKVHTNVETLKRWLICSPCWWVHIFRQSFLWGSPRSPWGFPFSSWISNFEDFHVVPPDLLFSSEKLKNEHFILIQLLQILWKFFDCWADCNIFAHEWGNECTGLDQKSMVLVANSSFCGSLWTPQMNDCMKPNDSIAQQNYVKRKFSFWKKKGFTSRYVVLEKNRAFWYCFQHTWKSLIKKSHTGQL